MTLSFARDAVHALTTQTVTHWQRPPAGTLRRGVVALYSTPAVWVVLALVAGAALVALALRARLRRR